MMFKHVYAFIPSDTNECGVGNGGCDHVCVNTVASYYCQCDIGYSLNTDIHSCDGIYIYSLAMIHVHSLSHIDINECVLNTHNCSHTCYNNNGSYTCDCEVGYKLDTDSLSCIG